MRTSRPEPQRGADGAHAASGPSAPHLRGVGQEAPPCVFVRGVSFSSSRLTTRLRADTGYVAVEGVSSGLPPGRLTRADNRSPSSPACLCVRTRGLAALVAALTMCTRRREVGAGTGAPLGAGCVAVSPAKDALRTSRGLLARPCGCPSLFRRPCSRPGACSGAAFVTVTE